MATMLEKLFSYKTTRLERLHETLLYSRQITVRKCQQIKNLDRWPELYVIGRIQPVLFFRRHGHNRVHTCLCCKLHYPIKTVLQRPVRFGLYSAFGPSLAASLRSAAGGRRPGGQDTLTESDFETSLRS